VELFTRATLFIAVGKTLDIITQAETVAAHAPLRQDLVRATYAAYLVELLDRFIGEEDPHAGIYQLLADALVWLTEVETADLLLVARYYELRLLSLTGFQPQLFHCVACGNPIEEQDQFFSAELGGLLCPNCYETDRNARPVTAVAVKVLRYLQSRPWDTVKVLQLKRPLHSELENLMHHYPHLHPRTQPQISRLPPPPAPRSRAAAARHKPKTIGNFHTIPFPHIAAPCYNSLQLRNDQINYKSRRLL
jgi:DNA repair protein RecO (recombination protein O)